MQFKTKEAEMYWAMRLWVIDSGSLPLCHQMEQQMTAIEFSYDKMDRLNIDFSPEWCSALALTFAYFVPKREDPRSELDRLPGTREKGHVGDYNPLDFV